MTQPLDNITCDTLRPLLHAYAANELSREEYTLVRAHIDDCTSCKAGVEQINEQLTELASLRDAAPPSVTVIARLKQQARQEIKNTIESRPFKDKTSRRRSRRWFQAAAVFAAVCAVLFLILQLHIKNNIKNIDINNKNKSRMSNNKPINDNHNPIENHNKTAKDNINNKIAKQNDVEIYPLETHVEAQGVLTNSGESSIRPKRTAQRPRYSRRKVVFHNEKTGLSPGEDTIPELSDPLDARIRSLRAEVDTIRTGAARLTHSSGWDDLDARINNVDSEMKSLNRRISTWRETPPDQSSEG